MTPDQQRVAPPGLVRQTLTEALSAANLLNPFSNSSVKQATHNAAKAIKSTEQLKRIDAIMDEHKTLASAASDNQDANAQTHPSL